MNAKVFSKLIVKTLDPELTKRSGRVLYSAATSLRKGRVYVLGLNPGGDPNWFDGRIRDNIFPINEENAYLDESWGGRQPGEHPLQKRISFLVEEQLGLNIRRVCASNLIFVRSQSAAKLSDFKKTADLCWPAHEAILNIVRPEALIVFGNSYNSPFSYLIEKVENIKWAKDFPSGHGNWNCRLFEGELVGRHVYVIGLPHLSRFNIINVYKKRKSPIINWIKKHVF